MVRNTLGWVDFMVVVIVSVMRLLSIGGADDVVGNGSINGVVVVVVVVVVVCIGVVDVVDIVDLF